MAVHTAALTFPIEPASDSQAILAALEPEVADGPPGTTTTIGLDGAILAVAVTADDLSGLRAAIHSVVRLLDAAQRTLG